MDVVIARLVSSSVTFNVFNVEDDSMEKIMIIILKMMHVVINSFLEHPPHH